MLTFQSENMSPSSRYLHVLGCLLGTALIVLFVASALGAGPPPFGPGASMLVMMLAGFLLAWWDGIFGGVVSLIGIVGFYVWNFAVSGQFPSGWVFPLCFVPGLLQVMAWFLRNQLTRASSQ